MLMIPLDSTTFKAKIEKSPELQADFLLCMMLHRTPGEILELEKEGLLTFEQRMFLQAGLIWKLENHIGGCPLF